MHGCMKGRAGTSRRLYRRAEKIFPGGVNSPVRYYAPYPLYMSGGTGSSIRDADGRVYTDYLLAYGPLILGHSHPRVVRAVSRVMEEGIMFGAPAAGEVELGEIISGSCRSVEQLRLVPSGSEATMHALRLAMLHTGRRKILKLRGGYHGTNSLALDPAAAREVEFNSVAQAERELKKGEYAAFILEPAMGNCGLVLPEDGYLQAVRDATEKSGTVMIADEVITGFRTGFGAYSEAMGVMPDLLTFGKIVGGGLPLAAFGGRRDMMKHVRPAGSFQQAGTYAAHPVSVAAGLETLRILSSSDYTRLEECSRIAALELAKTGLTVNSSTGMLSIFFTGDPVRNGGSAMAVGGEPFFRLFKAMLEEGIYLPPSQQELIFISFAHRKADVRRHFRTMAEAAASMAGRGRGLKV